MLRAVAALSVLVFHAPPSALHGNLSQHLGIWALPLDFAHHGVTLFLVISGFCIHLAATRGYSTQSGFRTNWRRFWRRRFRRLYPPYLAAIVLSLAVAFALAQPHDPDPTESLTWDLITHLLLIHNLTQFCLGLGNGPFWTLGLEEQLYGLFAVYLLLRRRCSAVTALGVTLAVELCWQFGVPLAWELTGVSAENRVVPVGPITLTHWGSWPFAFWFSWVLGAVAAESHAEIHPLPWWCSRYTTVVVLLALGMVISPTTWTAVSLDSGRFTELLGRQFSHVCFSCAMCSLLLTWLRAESWGRFGGPAAKFLAGIGVMSYSLYLVHAPVIRVCERVFGLGTDAASLPARYLVILPSSLLIASLFFVLVERWFLNTRPGSRR